MPSANPRQLCAHQSKGFATTMAIFWGFQYFLIYLVKYFWSLLNSPIVSVKKHDLMIHENLFT